MWFWKFKYFLNTVLATFLAEHLVLFDSLAVLGEKFVFITIFTRLYTKVSRASWIICIQQYCIGTPIRIFNMHAPRKLERSNKCIDAAWITFAEGLENWLPHRVSEMNYSQGANLQLCWGRLVAWRFHLFLAVLLEGLRNVTTEPKDYVHRGKGKYHR